MLEAESLALKYAFLRGGDAAQETRFTDACKFDDRAMQHTQHKEGESVILYMCE